MSKLSMLLLFVSLFVLLKGCNGDKNKVELQISGNNLGEVEINTTKRAHLNIKNPLPGTGVRITGLKNIGGAFSIEGENFPGTGGNCGRLLQPGDDCQIPIIVAGGNKAEPLNRDLSLVFNVDRESQEQKFTIYAKAFYALGVYDGVSSPNRRINIENPLVFPKTPKGNPMKKNIVLINPSKEHDALEVNFTSSSPKIFKIDNPFCSKVNKDLGCPVSIEFNPDIAGTFYDEVITISYTLDGKRPDIIVRVKGQS